MSSPLQPVGIAVVVALVHSLGVDVVVVSGGRGPGGVEIGGAAIGTLPFSRGFFKHFRMVTGHMISQIA